MRHTNTRLSFSYLFATRPFFWVNFILLGITISMIMSMMTNAHAEDVNASAKQNTPTYYKDTETLPYTVIDTIDESVEIRRYPATVAVAATGSSDNSAFSILFNYISGENSVQSDVTMTSPVEITSTKIAMTSPVEITQSNQMRFFLPSMYSMDTAPKPTNEAVKLIPVAPRTVAAITFSGWGREGNRKKYTQRLREVLSNTNISIVSEPSYMGYDSPFTLPWNKRNEIMVEVILSPTQ